MSSEIIDVQAVEVPKSRRGGRREGAGRKPSGYQKPEQVIDYEKARARKESALADLNELEFKIKSGQYVSRDQVQQAGATVLSTVAQALRSLSDNLERRGVPPEICVQVEAAVTETLADAAKDLQKYVMEEAEE